MPIGSPARMRFCAAASVRGRSMRHRFSYSSAAIRGMQADFTCMPRMRRIDEA
jgi:hypothetical protein